MELTIVVVIIVVLAVLLIPVIIGQAERARISAESSRLVEIGKAMQRFYSDTGRWPLDSDTWTAKIDIDPAEFGGNDIALLQQPVGMAHCTPALSITGVTCWDGPYLAVAESMDLRDPWGNPRLFALVKPQDGMGGGAPLNAPRGAIVIWSRGPDGIDQTGCFDFDTHPTACPARNFEEMAAGRPSVPGADDLILRVSAAN